MAPSQLWAAQNNDVQCAKWPGLRGQSQQSGTPQQMGKPGLRGAEAPKAFVPAAPSHVPNTDYSSRYDRPALITLFFLFCLVCFLLLRQGLAMLLP